MIEGGGFQCCQFVRIFSLKVPVDVEEVGFCYCSFVPYSLLAI